ALIRRRNLAGVSGNERSLQPQSNRIFSLVDRNVVFVFDNGPNGVYVSADSGELSSQKQACATRGRELAAIHAVIAKAWSNGTGPYPAQRIRTGYAVKVHRLEVLLGRIAKRL